MIDEAKRLIGNMVRWTLLAVPTGILCGLFGTLFHVLSEEAAELRGEYPWLLFLLPVAGLLIVAIYKGLKTEGLSTNTILDAQIKGTKVSIWLLPSIFIATVLTHLTGGSAGREGAALQMGGSIGSFLGEKFKLDDREQRLITTCGMSAFFTALFGTPVAATLFSIMVFNVGITFYSSFLPCMMSALTAYVVSGMFGVSPTSYAVEVPVLTNSMYLSAILLGIISAVLAIMFVMIGHKSEEFFKETFKNAYVRVLVGGFVLIGLTLLVGSQRYNGAGMGIIATAVEQGQAMPLDFVLKMIFTAITLGSGFKGGEVVPSFFIGATFGAFFGPYFGLPAGFAAALCMVGVFCGCTNCLVPSIVIAVEMFGSGGLPLYALVCALSYYLSGRHSFYHSQKIMDEGQFGFPGE